MVVLLVETLETFSLNWDDVTMFSKLDKALEEVCPGIMVDR